MLQKASPCFEMKSFMISSTYSFDKAIRKIAEETQTTHESLKNNEWQVENDIWCIRPP